MNNIDKQYQLLLQDILDNGIEKKDRTGTGTISVFGRQIKHKMSEGFPLITTKRLHFKSIVVELLWFLRGDTNIKYLVDNDCHIWDGDAYKVYREARPNNRDAYTIEEFAEAIKSNPEFAAKYGELGPIYGKQWRQWDGLQDLTDDDKPIYLDQIATLINDLKTNPDSRRMMVNAWNVGELDQMILPPCHYGFQVYTRKGKDEKRYISLMWNQRSVDTFLGLPFNIASYALLLIMLADEVNMVPDELIGNLGDTHLYSNHVEQAKEQITRESYSLPTITLPSSLQPNSGNWDKLVFEDFYLNDYQSHPTIKAPLSN
jgi:thymidylate synthase